MAAVDGDDILVYTTLIRWSRGRGGKRGGCGSCRRDRVWCYKRNLQRLFCPEQKQFSQKHPVISHLTILSAYTICKPSQPLTLYYSPITKELLLILAYFPLLGSVCVCVCVCWCNEIEYSNIAHGTNYDVAMYRKAVKQASLHSSFPLVFNVVHPGYPDTYNRIMCVQPWTLTYISINCG